MGLLIARSIDIAMATWFRSSSKLVLVHTFGSKTPFSFMKVAFVGRSRESLSISFECITYSIDVR